MYENFLSIDEEKQTRIINAAMMVFSKYPYKHANTEEIAHQAGISKGLLFYYFKNKASLYLYLYEYCQNVMVEYYRDIRFLLTRISLI